MNVSELLTTLAQRLSAVLPDTPGLLKRDLEKNFHAILEGVFGRLDLVTREEFDIQTRVLARCRERIAQLEAVVHQLESGKQP